MNQDSVFVYDPKSTSTDTVLLKYIYSFVVVLLMVMVVEEVQYQKL